MGIFDMNPKEFDQFVRARESHGPPPRAAVDRQPQAPEAQVAWAVWPRPLATAVAWIAALVITIVVYLATLAALWAVDPRLGAALVGSIWPLLGVVALWTGLGKALAAYLTGNTSSMPNPVISSAEAELADVVAGSRERYPSRIRRGSAQVGGFSVVQPRNPIGRPRDGVLAVTREEIDRARRNFDDYDNVLKAVRTEWRPVYGSTSSDFCLALGRWMGTAFTLKDEALLPALGQFEAVGFCPQDLRWCSETEFRLKGLSGKLTVDLVGAHVLRAWQAGSVEEFTATSQSLQAFADPIDSLVLWSIGTDSNANAVLRWQPFADVDSAMGQLLETPDRWAKAREVVLGWSLGPAFCRNLALCSSPRARPAARQLAAEITSANRFCSVGIGAVGLALCAGGFYFLNPLSGGGLWGWLLTGGGAALSLFCLYSWFADKVEVD